MASAPRDARPTRSGEAGFTFLEILLVLGIIAVAATLVAPAIDSGMRAREVRSAVRNLVATLRTLQSEARLTGTPQHLVIDPRENVLVVPEREVSVDLGPVAQMTEIRGGDLDPNGFVRVTFYPNGSTSGLDVLIDDRESVGDLGFVVSLDPLIGLVTIEEERR